jgi:hypothetical protein
MAYYRKEQSFKVDKEEFEELRRDCYERFTTVQQRVSEKDKYLNAIIEELESKTASKVTELKQVVNQRLDEAFNSA